MSIFCFKKLTPTLHLGDRLKQQREAGGFSVEDIAARTLIQAKYLEALEQGAYHELPKARAYRLAYVREYAAHLGLDPKECVRQFTAEEGLKDTATIHPQRTLRQFPFAAISILARNAVLGGVVLVFAGYLVWQIRAIVEPPRLLVHAPVEGVIIRETHTVIQGETEKESTLTVNGQEIMVNEAGKFETKIDLSPGVNTITVTASKKHGKISTITRHLVVKPSPKTEPLSLK